MYIYILISLCDRSEMAVVGVQREVDGGVVCNGFECWWIDDGVRVWNRRRGC